MAKQSRHTSVPLPIKNRLTGVTYFRWQSMPTASRLPPPLGSQFFANYERHPETTTRSPTEAKNPESLAYAHCFASTTTDNRKALEATRERVAKYADKRRATPPTYQVCSLVMHSDRTIKTKRPSRKLEHKFMALSKSRGSSRPLPSASRFLPNGNHPTFHVSQIGLFQAKSRPAADPARCYAKHRTSREMTRRT